MPRSIVLYHLYNNYEWGTRYYFQTVNAVPPADNAQDLADAEALLVCNDVLFNRYESFDETGVKDDEGALATSGNMTGDMMPLNYAIFLRLVSGGPKRPSTKYIHGFDEGFSTNGEPNVTLTTNITAYQAALIAAAVCDSDNVLVGGVVFRRFSRRRRLRRLL